MHETTRYPRESRVILRLCLIGCSLLAGIGNVSATEVSDFINKRNCDQILDKGFYQICYDYNAKGARFVSYTLDGAKVNSGEIKKRPRFYPDTAIPSQHRTISSDYTRNEFHADRGHLAPDASFDYSERALRSVYSMANIIPQYSEINRRTWIKAEKYERLIASRLGTVMVMNGVVYDAEPKRMRKSGIAYPRAFWKMLYDNHGFKRCFYYENDSHAKIKGDKLKDHTVECATLRVKELTPKAEGVFSVHRGTPVNALPKRLL